MRKALASLAMVVLAAGTLAVAGQASSSERWLHVRVEDGGKGKEMERVHVNVPLSFAEQVLPAIHVDRLQGGRVRLDQGDLEGVDLHAILQAVKDTRDGEFVTVDKGTDHVRVAKEKGNLLVKVREGKEGGSKVDVRVPMDVVEALLSGDEQELNVGAALRVLGRHGDELLVTVTDGGSNVRIWVDSQNSQPDSSSRKREKP